MLGRDKYIQQSH